MSRPTPILAGSGHESVWDYLRPGSFYGGWITSDVVGPFKGQPGRVWW